MVYRTNVGRDSKYRYFLQTTAQSSTAYVGVTQPTQASTLASINADNGVNRAHGARRVETRRPEWGRNNDPSGFLGTG